MQFKPQAIFIDLDGTLVDARKKQISEENKNEVIKVNQTIPCFISTGRGLSEELINTTQELGLDYGVAQNGAIIYDRSGKIIRKFTIKDSTYEQLFKKITKFKIPFIANSSKIIYSNSLSSKLIPLFKKEYKIEKTKNAQNLTDITKILLLFSSAKKARKIQKSFSKEFRDLNVLLASNHAIEINDINASKGKANSFICSLNNIDPLKTVHIGDSMNDSTTAQYMGCLIAMQNSSADLKKIASEQGEYFKKAGLAKILRKIANV
ncbi:Cof-type HAD-IIB family hydrolase [Mycoplasma phocoenae]|uniref:Cof-type HAD-IIB family hydrolase n=1 Tax=Mycoplasma phocoenae TaxID=754517 RepID=A0A858U454_9MOLU|nr:Cof-type HAD-IIB family hydrolase [Mycoplasma phocoenae]QJG67250.1 Cof-type HAD-IIB family hydrolase [Mycoplasma phocoenae]